MTERCAAPNNGIGTPPAPPRLIHQLDYQRRPSLLNGWLCQPRGQWKTNSHHCFKRVALRSGNWRWVHWVCTAGAVAWGRGLSTASLLPPTKNQSGVWWRVPIRARPVGKLDSLLTASSAPHAFHHPRLVSPRGSLLLIVGLYVNCAVGRNVKFRLFFSTVSIVIDLHFGSSSNTM